MLFMNDYDIAMSRLIAEREGWTVTLDALTILERLVDWANSNSDGWHSWPKPARAAAQLMTRIQEQDRKSRVSWPEQYDMTHNDRDLALRPIKAFLTRQNVEWDVRVWILDGRVAA